MCRDIFWLYKFTKQTRARALIENQFDHGCVHFVCCSLVQCNLIASKTPHPMDICTPVFLYIFFVVRAIMSYLHQVKRVFRARARIKTLIWACAFNEASKLHFLYCIYIKSYKISTPASTIFLCAHDICLYAIIFVYIADEMSYGSFTVEFQIKNIF